MPRGLQADGSTAWLLTKGLERLPTFRWEMFFGAACVRIQLARINHTDHHRWPGSGRVLRSGMFWSGTIRFLAAALLIVAVGVAAFALVTYVWF